MTTEKYYLYLYRLVLDEELKKHDVKTGKIKTALQNIKKSYSNRPKKTKMIVSYNDPVYRCAYLHKYAAFHAYAVQQMLRNAFRESRLRFMPSYLQILNICSMGGGPGIDIIAALCVFKSYRSIFRWSPKIIDKVCGWKDTLASILTNTRNGSNVLSNIFLPNRFKEPRYLVADQLGNGKNNEEKTLCSADLIIMSKFISSVVDMKAGRLIKFIFDSMRPGALFFFIGSAYGGFDHLVDFLGKECNMMTMYGPLLNLLYQNTRFEGMKRFGSRKCFKAQISVHLLMKPYTNTSPYNERGFIFYTLETYGFPNNARPRDLYELAYDPFPHLKCDNCKVASNLNCLKCYPHKRTDMKVDNIKMDDVGHGERAATNNKKSIQSSNFKLNENKTDDCGNIKLKNTNAFLYAENNESSARNIKLNVTTFTDVKSTVNERVDSFNAGRGKTGVCNDVVCDEIGAINPKMSAISFVNSELNASGTIDSGILRIDNTDVMHDVDCNKMGTANCETIMMHDADCDKISATNRETSVTSCTVVKSNACEAVIRVNMRLGNTDLLHDPDCDKMKATNCESSVISYTDVKSNASGAVDSENIILGNVLNDAQNAESSAGNEFPKDEMNIFPNRNCKSNHSHSIIVNSSSTTDGSAAQIKTILKDGIKAEDEKKCKYCFKLRRINWLKNKCRFCKN